MKIQTDSIKINYELSGDGACLVLIHGFSDNLSMWYNQVPAFSKQYKVLTFDTRGHGHTETPEDEFSREDLGEDLYALLKAQNIEKACVLGYSMGGGIGLEFTLKYPEMVTGLILANSGVMTPDVKPPPEHRAEMQKHHQQMMAMLETGDINTIADTIAELSFSPGLRDKNPAMFQRYKEVKLKNDPQHYVRFFRAMEPGRSNPPDITRLKCPVLCIAGEHDGFHVESAKSMARLIDDVTVKILKTGHASAIEAPEEFNQAVLDFMKRL